MRQKPLAFMLLIFSIVIAGCGEDEADTGSTWVGEVYASAGSGPGTVLGEFSSYDECVEMTQKKAESGVFNCGIK